MSKGQEDEENINQYKKILKIILSILPKLMKMDYLAREKQLLFAFFL